MGFSTGRDLHIDKALTQVAINYRPQEMIADLIAPIIPVEKETDLYPVFSRAEAFAVENTIRARGTEANKITRSVSSAGYAVKNYALGYDLPIEDRANMDAAYAFELEAGASRFLVSKLMLDYERRIINTISSGTNVSTTFLPNSAWNAASNAGDPIAQLFQVIEQTQNRTAQRPNSILFGWRAWNWFRRNTNVRNFILGNNNGGGLVTRQNAQALFEVDRLLVTQAFWNTANEAQAEALSSPFADKVLVYYAPLTPSREDPSYMYSFRWQNPALPAPMVVERHAYDTRRKVEGIEVGYYQDEKVTGTEYAALFSGVASAQAGGI